MLQGRHEITNISSHLNFCTKVAQEFCIHHYFITKSFNFTDDYHLYDLTLVLNYINNFIDDIQVDGLHVNGLHLQLRYVVKVSKL